MSEQKVAVEIKIEVDDLTAQGCYSNLALISHNECEFVFDFVYVQPQEPKGKVRSRIILNPTHAKRFLEALTDNINKFETKYGIIPTITTWPQGGQILPC